MDVISAKTEKALAMAEGHLNGQLSQLINDLRHNILGMIAHLEAAIVFPEDEVDEVVIDDVEKNIVAVRSQLRKLLQTVHTGRILRDGLMTAIIGKPNVGKSSLLNAMLREKRAVVTDIPGTTRDSIEEYVNIGGMPLRIIDTAGIRTTDDVVEKIGVDKSKDYIEKADLILALFDGSKPLGSEDEAIIALLKEHEALILLNKADLELQVSKEELEQKTALPVITLSTVTEHGLDELTKAITAKAYLGSNDGEEGSFVNDERQADILRKTDSHLKAALETIGSDMGLDFTSIDLRSAWEKLGELTGDTVGEDIIDEIFAKFCIGK